jgi:hypothetical protein
MSKRRKDTPPVSDAPHVRALNDTEARVWRAWRARERELTPTFDAAAMREAALHMTPGELARIFLPSVHSGRWVLVREGRAKGLTWLAAYDYAIEQAEGTPWVADTRRTVKESYDIVQKERRGGKKQTAPFRS